MFFTALLFLHPTKSFRTVRVAGLLVWPLDVDTLGACGAECYYQFELAREEEEREALPAP